VVNRICSMSSPRSDKARGVVDPRRARARQRDPNPRWLPAQPAGCGRRSHPAGACEHTAGAASPGRTAALRQLALGEVAAQRADRTRHPTAC
jgi:hypothetical protein